MYRKTSGNNLVIGNYLVFYMYKDSKVSYDCATLFMVCGRNLNNNYWDIKPIAVNDAGKKLLSDNNQILPDMLNISINEEVDVPDLESVINLFGPEIKDLIVEKGIQFAKESTN